MTKEVINEQECASSKIIDARIVGNIGMFSCLGWNIMPTARNARGVDIIAYSPDASHFIGIQAKSLSKNNPVPLGKTLDTIMGDRWIIVNNATSERPSTFIMFPNEVRERACRGEKDGRVTYWLQPRDYNQDQFREAWNRLALPSNA